MSEEGWVKSLERLCMALDPGNKMKVIPCRHCEQMVEKGYQKAHCGMLEIDGVGAEGKFRREDIPAMIMMLHTYFEATSKCTHDPNTCTHLYCSWPRCEECS